MCVLCLSLAKNGAVQKRKGLLKKTCFVLVLFFLVWSGGVVPTLTACYCFEVKLRKQHTASKSDMFALKHQFTSIYSLIL